MHDSAQAALRFAACLAFRHIDEVDESRREEVLVALVEVLPEPEARIAEQALFHLRESRRAQLELHGIVDRLVTPPPRSGQN